MDKLKPAIVIENPEYIYTVYDMNSLYPQTIVPYNTFQSVEEE